MNRINKIWKKIVALSMSEKYIGALSALSVADKQVGPYEARFGQ